MAKFSLAVIKKHPIATGVTIILAGIVAYAILKGGSSSSVVTSSQTDPAQAQLAAQQQQLQAQLQGLGIQAATQVQLKQLDVQSATNQAAVQYQIAQLTQAYQIQHDQLSSAVDIANINAQLEAVKSQNSTIVQQATVGAAAQIAAINASVQQAGILAAQNIQTSQIVSDAAVKQAQLSAQALLGGATIQADATKTAAFYGFLGNVFGGLGSFF